jgi:hypothetical protein
MIREYRTAAAFKQALEQRLRTASASGLDFARRRQMVVFDRLLARIAIEFGDAVTLKGGLAVELRIERARTTKDIDLRVLGAPANILDRLRAAARTMFPVICPSRRRAGRRPTRRSRKKTGCGGRRLLRHSMHPGRFSTRCSPDYGTIFGTRRLGHGKHKCWHKVPRSTEDAPMSNCFGHTLCGALP